MQVRITEPGWANFTGLFGHVQFEDGLSADISKGEAAALGALVSIENVDTGKNPSAAQDILDHYAALAQVETPIIAANVPAPELPRFTEAQLAEAVDKGGIKGLRELVKPLGVSGKSVAEIIGKVLQGQAAAGKPAEPEAPAPEPVAEPVAEPAADAPVADAAPAPAEAAEPAAEVTE